MGTGKFGVNKMMGVRSLLELFCSTSPIHHTLHYHKIGYTEFYKTDETFHINSVCNSEMSKKSLLSSSKPSFSGVTRKSLVFFKRQIYSLQGASFQTAQLPSEKNSYCINNVNCVSSILENEKTSISMPVTSSPLLPSGCNGASKWLIIHWDVRPSRLRDDCQQCCLPPKKRFSLKKCCGFLCLNGTTKTQCGEGRSTLVSLLSSYSQRIA